MNSSSKYLLILVLGFLNVNTIWGQNDLSEQKLKEVIRNLSEFPLDKDHFLVHSFLRDSKGFLWMGLRNSLIKHDGVHYQEFVFHPESNPGMLKQGPNIILEDHQNQLWLANWKGGLSIMDLATDSTRRISLNSEIRSEEISSIHLDSDSSIWITTPDFKLYLYDQEKSKFQSFQCPLPEIAIKENIRRTHFGQIKQDQKHPDILWIGSQFGLHKFDKKEKVFTYFAIDTFVKARYRIDPTPLLIDKKNQIWFGHFNREGLKIFDIETKEWLKKYNVRSEFGLEDGSNRIMNIQPYQDSFVIAQSWWNHFYLVNIYNLQDFAILKSYPHIKNNFGFYTDPVTKEVYWGLNSEILRTSPKPKRFNWFGFGRFLRDNEKGNFQSDMVYDTTREAHYIVTRHGDGVLVLSKSLDQLRFIRYQSKPGFEQVDITMYTMVQIGDSIYIGSEKGLFILNMNNEEIQPAKQLNASHNQFLGLPIQHISSHNGTLYICFMGGGIVRLSSNHKLIDTVPLFPNLRVRKIAFVNKTHAFAGTNIGLQLLNFEQKQVIENFTDSAAQVRLQTFEISDIEYEHDTFWVGSKGNGLIKLVHNKDLDFSSTFFTSNSDQGTNNINGILRRKNGELWVTSDFGVSKINPHSGTFENYGIQDGIGFAPRGNWFFELANGVIGMSAQKGFHYFDPNELLHSYQPVLPYLKSMDVFGKKIPTHKIKDGPFILDASDDHISFHMGAVNSNVPAQNNYTYKLEGYDKKWLRTKNNVAEAHYTNLPSGKFEFKFKASPKGERWSDDTVRIPFEVTPPFYQTLWFKAVVMLLLLLLAGGIIRYFQLKRIQKLEKLESESQILFLQKERAVAELTALRAQMNPHFLFNSLNSINWYILKNKPKDASKYISRFSKLIRLILEYSKTDLISIKEEIDCLLLYIGLEAMRFEASFQYDIQIAEDIQQDKMLIPPLIIQPFVENAIWHGLLRKSGEKNLSITIYQNEKELHIDIKDNGIGRQKAKENNADKSKKSEGILITKKRINKLNQHKNPNGLQIIDLQNDTHHSQGTMVQIRLPRLFRG